MKLILLDHNATTPLRPGVWEAMAPFFTEVAGNPSSSHQIGRKARQALHEARDTIARLLGATSDEVIFTSGATEANNLALFGLCPESACAIAASAIEHPCVIEPLKWLAKRNYSIRWQPVDSQGFVTTPARDEGVTLATLMLANHETGAIQDVRGWRKTFPRAVLHTDAAQSVGKIPVSFRELGVTTLTASAHKFGGPKGIGLLLLKKGITLRPLLLGGHQQQGYRPGTEPVPLVVGMAQALQLAVSEMQATRDHQTALMARFLQQLQAQLDGMIVHRGPAGDERWLPNTVNISFVGCRADLLLMALDLAGVACSTGSACSSGSLVPSPVIQAMGVSDEVLRSAMRFSLGPTTTASEIDEAAQRIVACVRRVRE